MSPSNPIPSSILIIGSGVFGLSTAYSLSLNPLFTKTTITLLDRSAFPSADGASIDSSRIVRADYADDAYAQLMAEAKKHWVSPLPPAPSSSSSSTTSSPSSSPTLEGLGAGGRYTQSGLCLVLGPDATDLGRNSIAGSFLNVRDKLGLVEAARDDGGEVQRLHSTAEIRRIMRGMEEGELGEEGYVNWTSGWADAEASMRFLRDKVEGSGRVDCRTGEVRGLMYEGRGGGKGAGQKGRVLGAHLVNGEEVRAELTLLATGAWTPAFVDLRGIASATGQVLAYTSLTDAEQERLGANPTLIDEGNGCFIITPRGKELKVARHGYGYMNPVTIPHPERHHHHRPPQKDPKGSKEEEGEEEGEGEGEEAITVSLPWTSWDAPSEPDGPNDPFTHIPPEGLQACRAYLNACIPSLSTRAWTRARLCWYMDTPSGDWLIDYHPRFEGLMVATGGSGHAFKFLPVVGERVVDVLLGVDRDELGKRLRAKWRWPGQRREEDHVWSDDWRGGVKGLVLKEEWESGRA